MKEEITRMSLLIIKSENKLMNIVRRHLYYVEVEEIIQTSFTKMNAENCICYNGFWNKLERYTSKPGPLKEQSHQVLAQESAD